MVEISKKERVQMAKNLITKCKEMGVKLPTDETNALIEAGTMLQATQEDGVMSIDAALKGLVEKFGMKERTKKRKVKTDVQEDKENDAEEEEDTPTKKKRKAAQAVNPKNQELSEIIGELAGFEFKAEEKFKGINLSKAAKSIRECEEVITTGKQAQKLKGIGKSTAAKIDQFLESGKIDRLEEYRAGNL